jgi:hypothetical protein
MAMMIAMKIHPILLGFAGAATLAAASLAGAPAAGPVEFRPHDIDASFRGGYAVAVADFNKDGKLDVMPNSLAVNEVAWYENPGWQRHVIVPEMTQIVNQAIADINGDGIPEVAYENSFAMQAANSKGFVWLARSQGDPAQPWKTEKIDEFPTSHHIAWADLDGDGKLELVNAPLIGEKSVAPTYDQDQASVFFYSQSDWKRQTITTSIPGIIHRVRVNKWDGNKRDQLLVASFEGVGLYRSTGSGANMKWEKELLTKGHEEKAPRLGASDVGVGKQDGKKFFATVEPWHGNEVVVYTEGPAKKWNRRVIYDKVASGHEIAVVDLNGDGRDDIVANDNSAPNQRNPNTPMGGVHIFYAPENAATGEWKYQRLEDKAAMNGCVAADMNNDKKVDLVCTGASGIVRWYENLGSSGTARTQGQQ